MSVEMNLTNSQKRDACSVVKEYITHKMKVNFAKVAGRKLKYFNITVKDGKAHLWEDEAWFRMLLGVQSSIFLFEN